MSVKVFCDADDCATVIADEAHHFTVMAGVGNIVTHQLHYHENCLVPEEIKAIFDDVDHTPIDFITIRLHNFPSQEPQG